MSLLCFEGLLLLIIQRYFNDQVYICMTLFCHIIEYLWSYEFLIFEKLVSVKSMTCGATNKVMWCNQHSLEKT